LAGRILIGQRFLGPVFRKALGIKDFHEIGVHVLVLKFGELLTSPVFDYETEKGLKLRGN
jgi:hypothetical protein